MSAVALSKTISLAGTKAAAPVEAPTKGVFARIVDAIVAARMAQAERELARYIVLRDPEAH